MRCSVVFGVTLRLLVINISSFSLAVNTAAYYQRYITTCGTVAVVHRRRCWQHLPIAGLTAGSEKPDVGSESRFLPTTPAFDAPFRGVPVKLLLGRLPQKKKLEWCGYPMVKKFDMFIRFNRIHERDGHTERRTDRQRPHDGIGRAYA